MYRIMKELAEKDVGPNTSSLWWKFAIAFLSISHIKHCLKTTYFFLPDSYKVTTRL